MLTNNPNVSEQVATRACDIEITFKLLVERRALDATVRLRDAGALEEHR